MKTDFCPESRRERVYRRTENTECSTSLEARCIFHLEGVRYSLTSRYAGICSDCLTKSVDRCNVSHRQVSFSHEGHATLDFTESRI